MAIININDFQINKGYITHNFKIGVNAIFTFVTDTGLELNNTYFKASKIIHDEG